MKTEKRVNIRPDLSTSCSLKWIHEKVNLYFTLKNPKSDKEYYESLFFDVNFSDFGPYLVHVRLGYNYKGTLEERRLSAICRSFFSRTLLTNR